MPAQIESLRAESRWPFGSVEASPINCLLQKADPLVRWLIEQPFQSITHWGLYAKARELYGDPFTALAVIGQLFDYERQTCASRRKGCVLGNRMRPLFAPGQTKYVNPVGENYHFWAQLNASLTESSVKEKTANYILEWAKDGDSGEYSANLLGIHIGGGSALAARDHASRLSPAPLSPTCKLN